MYLRFLFFVIADLDHEHESTMRDAHRLLKASVARRYIVTHCAGFDIADLLVANSYHVEEKSRIERSRDSTDVSIKLDGFIPSTCAILLQPKLKLAQNYFINLLCVSRASQAICRNPRTSSGGDQSALCPRLSLKSGICLSRGCQSATRAREGRGERPGGRDTLSRGRNQSG